MPVPRSASHHEAAASITRRTFLGGIGAVAGSALVPLEHSTASVAPAAFTSFAPVTAAMHVHAGWSEGMASWEAQFAQARSVGCNLIFMTDHDFRALAWNYLPNLDDVPYTVVSTGSFQVGSSTASGSTLHLVAESATSGRAELTTTVEEKPTSWNRLRTSIAGTVVQHTFADSVQQLDDGATYEVVFLLSQHPAREGRPAGQYSLRYRYGSGSGGTYDPSITGVKQMGAATPGRTDTFDLVNDWAQFFPTMPAIDNGLQKLRFVVTSPSSGIRADVVRDSVTMTRTGHTEAAIAQQQAQLVSTYGPAFPGLAMRPSVEVSQLDPHVNAFGVPQFFPNQDDITPDNVDTYYSQLSANVHGQGGLLSWNHPFGANAGPLLSGADQTAKRRQVYADMRARNLYGVDILEVGYSVRGLVNTQAHFDLWDTFSRQAIFLTGNGVNDDHIGLNWGGLSNGWTTGIWASGTDDLKVIPALRSGRAYTRHTGKWRNGQIDLRVDSSVVMGKVSPRDVNRRSLEIFAANLPAGSTVQVVRGPVDRTGTDPGTSVLTSIGASSFSGASHIVARSIDTSRSCFVRAQVRNSAGALIGTSNPIWLLRGSGWSIPPGRA